MAFNKSLNAACNLNEYLVCKMPEGTLEVEVKGQNHMGESLPWFKTLIPGWRSSVHGKRPKDVT